MKKRCDPPLAAATKDERGDRKDQKDDEQDLGDSGGAGSDAAEAEDGRDQRNDEKYNRVMQHGFSSVAGAHGLGPSVVFAATFTAMKRL